MRVLIVDDSAFMRKALSTLIGEDPQFEIVGTARDGQEGLDKVRLLKPDLVTLDIEMPVMDGLTALQKIAALPEPRPLVLMCSTLTTEGSHAALKAMRLGAADIIAKDPQALGAGSPQARKELLAKLKAMGDTRRHSAGPAGFAGACAVRPPPAKSSATPGSRPAPVPHAITLDPRNVDLIVIGSSTGGPPVLEQILSALPRDLPVPVVVAQHMPRLFTKSISERLNDLCQIRVAHAEADTDLAPATAYIIPGGMHGRVHRAGATRGGRTRLEISEVPTDALYKPSVHELFMSCAKSLLGRGVGVMLTGMGDDGGQGAKAMHKAGATVLAQSAETCVVYGMPKAVVDAGAATAALSPADIALSLRTLAAPAAAAAPSSGARAA